MSKSRGLDEWNIDELLSYGDIEAKKKALLLAEEALKASNPYNSVYDRIRVVGDTIVIDSYSFPIRGGIYVVAIGKAACSMAKAVEDKLGDKIVDGVAITKYGYRIPLKYIRVVEAGHPIPDENSLKGTEEALRIAKKVRENDILFFLISGGGSALFVYPENDLSLNDIITVNELLLKSGAKIHEINVVRKHLSRVKGGKFAKLVRGTLISLILSDVVGDKIESIASGPTSKDPSTFSDAFRVLVNYGLLDKIPQRVRSFIERGMKGKVEETLKEDLPNVYNIIVGSVKLACEAVAKKAAQLGLKPYILTTTLEGEAKDAAIAFGSIIEEIKRYNRPFSTPCAIIAGGETTVTIYGEPGLGGPNQEFALSIARKIKDLDNVAVLALDTDGTDGPTDAAGGLVDSKTYYRLIDAGIDIEDVLNRHDSYNALKKCNALLITGPTYTNVNSIYIAVIL
ncbi:MAG: glycerate kinase [Desulfurococcales archaeon]|nr:glycerate kinase [Desulfurococcales archaeon]